MPPRDAWDCRLRNWRLTNQVTGETTRVQCGTWACPEHGQQLSWRWRKRAELVRWKLMLTLTQVPEDRVKASKTWTVFMRWLRREWGATTYLRAMEIGAGGMRHWHVLLRGVDRVDHYALSRYAKSLGLGKIVYETAIKDGDDDYVKAAAYVVKYATKGSKGDARRFRGWRRITASRDLPTWKKISHYVTGFARDESNQWVVRRGNLLPPYETRDRRFVSGHLLDYEPDRRVAIRSRHRGGDEDVDAGVLRSPGGY